MKSLHVFVVLCLMHILFKYCDGLVSELLVVGK